MNQETILEVQTRECQKQPIVIIVVFRIRPCNLALPQLHTLCIPTVFVETLSCRVHLESANLIFLTATFVMLHFGTAIPTYSCNFNIIVWYGASK